MRFTPREMEAADKIRPLLEEPGSPVSLRCLRAGDEGREPLQALIGGVFRRAYGACISGFYPDLLGFELEGRLRGAAGLRPAGGAGLFAEQYLDRPAHELIAEHTDSPCPRARLLEIGNLALPDPGVSRCAIAALTAFLHGAGFQWAVFTAVPALRNAFRRMGLEPAVLGPADPARMPDGGRSWGSYYRQRPVVCFGSIGYAFRKLGAVISPRQPRLHRQWEESVATGIAYRGRLAGAGMLESTGT